MNATYRLPSKPFNDPMRFMLITNRTLAKESLENKIRAACASGVRLVQLREKDLNGKSLLLLAQSLRTTTTHYGATLIVNSRLDIALAAEADGLHLPEQALPVQTVRRFFSGLVGRSVHSIEGAKKAEHSGADYLLFGHIFETASKTTDARGLHALEEVCKSVSIPVYAVGGITPERVKACLSAGAFGVAVMNGVMSASDVQSTVKNFLNALNDTN
ncbi:MAG: thiamine phosphate synthase [Chlorobiales bacterium]